MFISKLKLQNWKNFKSIDVNLSERNFIIGANASGKSNLLDAVRFLSDIVKQAGGLQYAVDQRGSVKKIRYISARKPPGCSIEIHLKERIDQEKPNWLYRLQFKGAGGGIQKTEAQILEEKVWDYSEEKYLVNRPTAEEDNETLKYTYLEQPIANRKFREIYDFLQKVEYLHVVPQLVRESDSYILTDQKEDFYGRNMFERMASMNQKTRDAHLKRINEVLKIAVPQLDNLEFKSDKNGVPHLEARYQHWRPKGAKQQENQFSDGTLRLLGFLWALLDGRETILLEEPELNLHTEIVRRLPEFIRRMQQKKDKMRQVLITTHSYDLLDNHSIGADEIIVLLTTEDGTEVKRADNITEIKAMLESGLSPAESTLNYVKPKDIEQFVHLKWLNNA